MGEEFCRESKQKRTVGLKYKSFGMKKIITEKKMSG